MTTGNIDTYLNYKAYEQTYQNPGGYQTPKSGEELGRFKYDYKNKSFSSKRIYCRRE